MNRLTDLRVVQINVNTTLSIPFTSEKKLKKKKDELTDS